MHLLILGFLKRIVLDSQCVVSDQVSVIITDPVRVFFYAEEFQDNFPHIEYNLRARGLFQ